MPDLDQTSRILGASYLGNHTCRFLVWSPFATQVDLHLVEPRDQLVSMEAGGRGYFRAKVEDVEPGFLYTYRLDSQKEMPDPAARLQSRGVHGPSCVTGTDFSWEDGGWSGIPFEEYIFYELHVGTFTREGTFEAIIPHLDELRKLGITAVELMPVAQFPGDRNWGADSAPFRLSRRSWDSG